MPKIRFGILSTARIGTQKVIPALQSSQYCEVVAIASRNLEKAMHVAKTLHIPEAYGSYESLLEAPTIDAIYNPLPNHLHVEWSTRALEFGKHVLCEKPIAISAHDAFPLVEASTNHPSRKVMEAFMYRFHPQWVRAKYLIESGTVGELRSIHSIFAYHLDDPLDIRNQGAIGGGGLLDIGCYNVSISRFIFGEEPRKVCATLELDPVFQTDRLTSGVLEFSAGQAIFTCATQVVASQSVEIYGTRGKVRIEVPFSPSPTESTRIWLEQSGRVEEISFPPANQYTLQGDAFARSILDNTQVPTPLDDALANMRVIDAIFRSNRERRWIEL